MVEVWSILRGFKKKLICFTVFNCDYSQRKVECICIFFCIVKVWPLFLICNRKRFLKLCSTLLKICTIQTWPGHVYIWNCKSFGVGNGHYNEYSTSRGRAKTKKNVGGYFTAPCTLNFEKKVLLFIFYSTIMHVSLITKPKARVFTIYHYFLISKSDK